MFTVDDAMRVCRWVWVKIQNTSFESLNGQEIT